MFDKGAWQRDYERRRAKQLDEAGLCVICGKTRQDGYKTCENCRARAQENSKQRPETEMQDYRRIEAQRAYRDRRRERLTAQGLCTTCGKQPAIDGLMYCTECREKNRTKKRDRWRTARETGMCVSCMKVKARPGRTMCFTCACAESARRDSYYWKKKTEARA